MSRTPVLALVGIVLVGLALAGSAGESGSSPEQRYGYGVTVQPDAQWADFIECGLTVFRLDTGEKLPDLPTLRIMAGTHNGMFFRDGELDVELSCGVNRQMTEVVYEVKGTVGDRTVLSYQATVRPKA